MTDQPEQPSDDILSQLRMAALMTAQQRIDRLVKDAMAVRQEFAPRVSNKQIVIDPADAYVRNKVEQMRIALDDFDKAQKEFFNGV